MRNLLPRLVGLADVLAIACYFVDVSPMYGQGIGLGLKLMLVPLLLSGSSLLLRRAESLLLLAFVCLISLVFSNTTEWLDVLPVVAFLAHLSLSLLLREEQIGEYLRTVALLVAGSAAVYLLMVPFDLIPSFWGRFYYFNEYHPNLGSEIAAAGAICGVISLRYRTFMATSALMLATTLLMQGRAAMLAIGLAMVLRSLHESFLANDASRVQFKLILITPVAIALTIFTLPYLSDALLIDDSYRGVGTGVVGRTDQWEIAWNAFLDRPITGQGIGWFEKTQESGAHNFFLYGFAEMGLFAALLYAMLAHMTVAAYRRHGWKIVSLSPVLIMFMVNDRFINLNLYPFMIWFLAAALSARPLEQAAPAGAMKRAADPRVAQPAGL